MQAGLNIFSDSLQKQYSACVIIIFVLISDNEWTNWICIHFPCSHVMLLQYTESDFANTVTWCSIDV